MRDLLEDQKKHKQTAKTLREKFVFLNVYCKSVKEEHDPRGPDGPYQFKDRSVPVVVIKKWDGTTLKQQLGWGGGARELARLVDRAAKDNGPVAPPKALRPLIKSYAKAQQALERKQVRVAVRELQKVIKAAHNKKKFKLGIPDISVQAQQRLDRIESEGAAALDALDAKPPADVKEHKAALNRLMSKYRGLPALKKRIQTALRKVL